MIFPPNMMIFIEICHGLCVSVLSAMDAESGPLKHKVEMKGELNTKIRFVVKFR